MKRPDEEESARITVPESGIAALAQVASRQEDMANDDESADLPRTSGMLATLLASSRPAIPHPGICKKGCHEA